MKILAISGSGRKVSTNTALLRAVSHIAEPDHQVIVFAGVGDLPVFTPDLEVGPRPAVVRDFGKMIKDSEGVIISSPEYVRAIPGGLKNAIDWLVSGEEIVQKPIALLHASHRGDDMLAQLRLVLSTVSQRFAEDVFLRFAFMKLSPEEVSCRLALSENRVAVSKFLSEFSLHCRQ